MEYEKIDLNRLCLNGREERWIKHYGSSQTILLVGEGDFSFAGCLAKAFGSGVNMVATSLDSRQELRRKYRKAISNVKELEGSGCTILHEVDAHTMDIHPDLNKLKPFDRIVFNFPHSGYYYCIQEAAEYVISEHQTLVRGFFKSARSMVAETGEIHVTHKTTYPFRKWKIVELAEEYGLQLVEKAPFSIWDYPGYTNKKGGSPGCYYRSDSKFPIGECSTYKFALASQCCSTYQFDLASQYRSTYQFDLASQYRSTYELDLGSQYFGCKIC